MTTLDDVVTRRHLTALADGQYGLLTRRQALSAGMSDGALAAQLRAARWQRVHHGVYATFTGELTRVQLMTAALLHGGTNACLSHETAAELHGFVRPADPLHVTSTRRVTGLPGVRVHRVRTLRESDLHPAAYPTRTRVERTVLDLVNSAASADRAFSWVASACQARCTTPTRLLEAAEGAPNLRWRSLVVATLPDVASGVHTLLEQRFTALGRRHQLPEPRRQVRVLAGRATRWLDVDYDPLPVVVELDGRLGHEDAAGRWRDMRRDNDAVVRGKATLRYGWVDVTARACAVAAQVAAVLAAAGWRARARKCGSSCEL